MLVFLYNSRMEKYTLQKEYQIKYCEVDFQDNLKMSSVLSYLEEVACLSADELGFGYEYLKPKGYAFMVSSTVCHFERPIRLSEVVRMVTWPTPPSYVVFEREYQIFSNSGNLLCNAASRWCLIDWHTGKLLKSTVIDNQDYSTYNTQKALENPIWKIPKFDLLEGELKFTLTIANSEYDHNLHVNNTKYADYCINCFSINELEGRFIKEFAISYVRQCKEGQTLRFYLKCGENGEYYAQGVNEMDEIVVQARIVFDK